MLRALYPDAVKPKSHHILHLPEQVAAIGYAANCFTGERKHHWLKLLAEHKFRGFERAVATEMLAICADDRRSRGARPPPQLISPTDSAVGAEIWAEVFGPCACQASAAADLIMGGARRGASTTSICCPVACLRLAAEVRAAVAHCRRPNGDVRVLPELL